MANVKNNAAAQETRRRLLEAAGEVFAERGLHAATIKDITDRAGASLAAVNYHFHDKAELYAEVIRRIEAEARQIIPPDDAGAGDARTRFCRFVRHVVLTMLGRRQPAWERILMAREFALPSPAMDSLLDNVARPLNERLSALVGELLARDPSDERVGHAVASVLGQCVYYLQHQPHLRRLHPQLESRPDPARVADHIAAFSLAGVLARRDARPRAPARRKRA